MNSLLTCIVDMFDADCIVTLESESGIGNCLNVCRRIDTCLEDTIDLYKIFQGTQEIQAYTMYSFSIAQPVV
jgi:hypothetical protein